MENFEGIHLPWSGWKIVKYIGGGAYGKVYEIERNISGIQEKAALKIISRPREASELETDYQNGYDRESIAAKYTEILQDYISEYKLMKELQGQSNIVSCDDFAIEENPDGIGGRIYIRMELLTPLQKVTKERLLSEEEVIRLGKDICKALILCENRNIIHRDIKPDNVMISKFGDFKLGDFGVSKVMGHTTSGTMTGTEGYIAPEVLHMEKYGKEVDIYSLGIVMYWLLNNRRMPFIGADEKLTPSKASEASLRRYQGEKIPAPKNGSDRLKQIVLKACEYRPKDRFTTAQEMYDELDRFQRNLQSQGISEAGTVSIKNNYADQQKENAQKEVDVHPQKGNVQKKAYANQSGEKDLHVTIQVATKELGKSKVITIEYPNGVNRMFEVEIPANKLNGSIIRLKGQGNTSEGDLILHLAIGKNEEPVFVEEDWQESNETVGKNRSEFHTGQTVGESMYGFNNGQTAGNSWGGGFETIGAYGKKTPMGSGNAYEEQEVSETIGIKNPHGKQMKSKDLDDLHVTIQITESELGSNKKVTVDYPDGRKKSFNIEIPANKLNGSIIRLKGEGNTSKGDLIFHLAIQKKQVYVAEGVKETGKKYPNQTEKLDEEKEWKLAMVEEMAWTSGDKAKAGIVTVGVGGLALAMIPALGAMAVPMWGILFVLWYFLAIKGREPEIVNGWIIRSKKKIDFDNCIANDTVFAKRLYYDKCPKKTFLKYIKKLNPEAAEEIKASK